MYIKIQDTPAVVVGVSSNDMVTSFAIQGQYAVSAVSALANSDIQLYEDEACTTLAAIYRAEKIVRISYEPDNELINLTVQASRLPDLEADQIKEQIALQQATITEQATTIKEQKTLIANQAARIESLEEELAAAKILLGLEDEGSR